MTAPRIPPWRWNLWGPWPPDGSSPQEAPPTDEAIRARADQLSKSRPWCTAEENWEDARLELNSPLLLRWRPTLLRWLGASEKKGWDWMDLSIKLSVPLTVALVGSLLGTINSNRQNEIAQANQKDAVVREYIKEMKEMLLDKAMADEARKPGTGPNGVARALTLTALTQLKGNGPERRSLVFQFLRESNFPILAGSGKQGGANLGAYDLTSTNLSEANLRGAYLNRAYLSEADLRGTYLIGANLNRADLWRANLNRADLSGANLIGAYLSGANLSGAYLNRANLIGADLIGANLNRAVLWRANLKGARLSEANLNGANLQDVQWDSVTTWPSPDRFKDAKNIPPALKKKLGL